MKSVEYNGIVVYYTTDLQGGGQGYGYSAYLDFLKGCPPVGRVYEWCSGPAFIGFSLLAHGVCESLCLSDINPEAVEVCKKTVEANGLHDKVSVYLSDNLHDIPEGELWDLVVGNPPHFSEPKKGPLALRSFDFEWETHRVFYSQLKQHLKDDGLALILENNGEESVFEGSSYETFIPQIRAGGLEPVFTARLAAHPRMFWVCSMHSTPAWEASSWKQFLA